MKQLLTLLFIFAAFTTQAFEPGCYRDLQVNFFESKAVMEAFSLHDVPQNMWAPLVRGLQVESQRVPQMVRTQALQMQPNPLDPFQSGPAMDLLRDNLYAIFYEVLNASNYNQDLNINQDDIRAMFDYISNKQAYRIERCFGKPTPETARNPNQSTNINIYPNRPDPSNIQQSPRSAPSPRAKNALPNPFDSR